MQEVVLQIRMSADGQIHLAGPLANKVLCYGLLEAAKDALRGYQHPAEPAVAIPEPGLVPGLLSGASRK